MAVRFTPEQLRGECVVCGRVLTEADYDRGRVVALIGPEGTVVCCERHLSEDGPEGPKYRRAVRAMAKAKVRQLRREAHGNRRL